MNTNPDMGVQRTVTHSTLHHAALLLLHRTLIQMKKDSNTLATKGLLSDAISVNEAGVLSQSSVAFLYSNSFKKKTKHSIFLYYLVPLNPCAICAIYWLFPWHFISILTWKQSLMKSCEFGGKDALAKLRFMTCQEIQICKKIQY